MNNITILAGAILLLIVGCTSEGVIKIGYSGPLTGDVAIAGQENLRGIQLVLDKVNAEGGINGKMLELSIKDDRFMGKETVDQYYQLTQVEGINYIITSTYGGYLALAEQAEQDNVILLESLDVSEELAGLSKNAFGVGIYDESIGYAIADFFNKKGIKKIGIITNIDDPFLSLVRNAFEDRYRGAFDEQEYHFSTKDHNTVLKKLENYDYIVILGFEEAGLIVKQARQRNMKTKFVGIDTFSSQDFRDNTGGNYQDVFFTFWEGSEENPVYIGMVEDYKTKYGGDSENVLFTATGYNAAHILVHILKICEDNVECAKSEMQNIENFQSSTGKITIDPDGITRSVREIMYTYQGDNIVRIE